MMAKKQIGGKLDGILRKLRNYFLGNNLSKIKKKWEISVNTEMVHDFRESGNLGKSISANKREAAGFIEPNQKIKGKCGGDRLWRF